MTLENDQSATPWRRHIAPTDTGFDELAVLREFIVDVDFNTVMDYGCGYGRLSTVFKSEGYLGVDQELLLVKEAKERNPNHAYQHTSVGVPATKFDLLLAYTVFVHMLDEDVWQVVDANQPGQLVIVEILGREWRRPGFPPVYNRELRDYASLLKGYCLTKMITHEHRGYTERMKKPVYVSFMLWEKF